MDQEKHPAPRRPVWAWLTVGGGITLIALVGVSVVALSQRPVSGTSPDRPVAAQAPAPGSPEEQLAITPPPPPRVPPRTDDADEDAPPTGAPPMNPDATPIWPPPPPPSSDLKGAAIGVPGPQQALRPAPRPAPRLVRPAPSLPRDLPRGGRDG